MKKLLALAAAAVVSACSGSDKNDPTPPPTSGEPNDTIATATALTLGTPVVATISTETDYDYYAFTVPTGGATVNIQTFDQGGTSCDLANDSVDTYIEVYGPDGGFITADDDSGINWCEDLNVTLPAGTNYVAVSGYYPFPFVYTLKVRIP